MQPALAQGDTLVTPSFLLSAGLVLGQTPVISDVQVLPGSYHGPYPAAVRQVSGRPTYYPGNPSPAWQDAPAWSGGTQQTGWFQEKSIFGRIQDRIGNLFGRKERAPETPPNVPMPADVRWHQGMDRIPNAPVPAPRLDTQPRLLESGLTEVPGVPTEASPPPLRVDTTAEPPLMTGKEPVVADPVGRGTAAPTPRLIPLTPDGSFTIEVVPEKARPAQAVKPVRFDPRTGTEPRQASPARPGHAADFSWIEGRLILDNNRLMIRFSPQDEATGHGGRLVLGYTGTLEARIGDRVLVRGELVHTNGEPIYMVDAIRPVPSGD